MWFNRLTTKVHRHFLTECILLPLYVYNMHQDTKSARLIAVSKRSLSCRSCYRDVVSPWAWPHRLKFWTQSGSEWCHLGLNLYSTYKTVLSSFFVQDPRRWRRGGQSIVCSVSGTRWAGTVFCGIFTREGHKSWTIARTRRRCFYCNGKIYDVWMVKYVKWSIKNEKAFFTTVSKHWEVCWKKKRP